MSSRMGGRRLKKYFVTIDDEECEEVFSPSTKCTFCDAKGSYILSEAGVGLCLECMYKNYKKIRVEEVPE